MSAFLTRLGDLQVRRPLLFIVTALLLAAAATPFALRLRMNGDFTALLPEEKPSVRDLEAIQEQFGGKATLTVMLKGPDSEALRSVARRLAPELEAMKELGVVHVDWNVSDFIAFAEKNRFLYAETEDLEEMSDALYGRLRHEMAKANPLLVDLGDGEPPDPGAVAERLERESEEAQHRLAKYPGGFFEHPDQGLIALFVRSSIRGGDTALVNEKLDRIRGLVDDARRELSAPDVEVFFGGDLMDIKEETDALTRAVVMATVITLVLVFASIWFFFRSWRVVPLLGVALACPVIITFAFAWGMVEYLNASTAFLSTIVVGNGINPNVIWLARYFESRRSGESIRDALVNSHRSTWAATLTASLAAGLAYGSLIITEFRGFRDFGVIGGAGMVLCWLGAYLLLPALFAFSDGIKPLSALRAKGGGGYGRAFAKLAADHPKYVLAASAVVTALSFVAVYQAIRGNPLEYDFRNLQSQRDPDSMVQWVNDRQGEIVDETMTGSAIAILLDERSQTSTVVRQLEAYKAEHPTAFGAVRTLEDLVPDDQDYKLELLDEIREVIPKLKKYANEEEKAQLEKNEPPEDLEEVDAKDLPESVARFFRDKEGRLGRIIYLEHDESRNGWDGRYMIEWAGAARSVRLPDGERPPVVGQPPIFVDLLDAIFKDGPQAVGVALAATVVLLLLTFRGWQERMLTLASLLVGILWMAALMAAGGMKLNFLNFVAFPVTFGNGVDYGVNVMRRYVQEREGGLGAVAAMQASVRGTGGAVILCSLTTIIGYISLYTSSNRALNSFGAAMGISEITCVAAGVLALPAALVLLHRNDPVRPPPSTD